MATTWFSTSSACASRRGVTDYIQRDGRRPDAEGLLHGDRHTLAFDQRRERR